MNNPIEFLLNSALGIAVLAILCRMIFNLYKYYNTTSSYFDGEIQPSKPWPRGEIKEPDNFESLSESLRCSCETTEEYNKELIKGYVEICVNNKLNGDV